MVLTADGSLLMRHATAAFEELQSGLEQISAQRSGLLRLHCAPSFAIQVLSPRLPAFLEQNPGVEVKIAASAGAAKFPEGAFDADIVYGASPRDDLVTLPLGEEIVVPLCTPAIANQIHTVRDLAHMTLIRSDLKRVQWTEWLSLNGFSFTAVPGMSFDRSFLAIAAASNGLGVALESTRLAEPELTAGRLVIPLAGAFRPYRYVGHFLCFPRSGGNRRVVNRFAEWLVGEFSLDPVLDPRAPA